MNETETPSFGILGIALEWIVSICLVFMMLMTFADVLGRYLLDAPVFGASEMIQFSLAGSVFAGLGLVSLRDGHISVDLFSPGLARRFPVAHRLLVDLVTIGGLCLIGFQLGRIGIEALETGRKRSFSNGRRPRSSSRPPRSASSRRHSRRPSWSRP